MLIFTEEQVKKAYDNSSEIMQSLLLEEWVIENSTLLGRKYKLRMDKVGVMNKLISYVMLNLIPMSRFNEYLKKELGLDDKTVLSLSKDLDENVFQKIKEEVIIFKKEKMSKREVKSIFEENTVEVKKETKGEIRDYDEILDENKSKNKTDTNDPEKNTKDPYRSFID